MQRKVAQYELNGQDFTIDTMDLPKGYFRSATFIGSLLPIGLSFGCGLGGFTFATPILTYINQDIGPSPNVTWVILTYTLTTGVCLIMVGRLTDLFGRRWYMIVGTTMGTIGSVVCATAQDILSLIAGETLIGISASAQISFACRARVAYRDLWRHEAPTSLPKKDWGI